MVEKLQGVPWWHKWAKGLSFAALVATLGSAKLDLPGAQAYIDSIKPKEQVLKEIGYTKNEDLESKVKGFTKDGREVIESLAFSPMKGRVNPPLVLRDPSDGSLEKLDYRKAYMEYGLHQNFLIHSSFIPLILVGMFGLWHNRNHRYKIPKLKESKEIVEKIFEHPRTACTVLASIPWIALQSTVLYGGATLAGHLSVAKTGAMWTLGWGLGLGSLFDCTDVLAAPKIQSTITLVKSVAQKRPAPSSVWNRADANYHMGRANESKDLAELAYHFEKALKLKGEENPFDSIALQRVVVDRFFIPQLTFLQRGDLTEKLSNQINTLGNYDHNRTRNLVQEIISSDPGPDVLFYQSRVLDILGDHREAYQLRNSLLNELFDQGVFLRIDTGDSRHAVYEPKGVYISNKFVLKEFETEQEALDYVEGRRQWNQKLDETGFVDTLRVYEPHNLGGSWFVPKDHAGHASLDEVIGDLDLGLYKQLFTTHEKLSNAFSHYSSSADATVLAQRSRDKFNERMSMFLYSVGYSGDESSALIQELDQHLAPLYKHLEGCELSVNFDFKLSNIFWSYPRIGLPDTESFNEVKAAVLDRANIVHTSPHGLVDYLPELVDSPLQDLYVGILIRGGDMLGYYSENERDSERREQVLKNMLDVLASGIDIEGFERGKVYRTLIGVYQRVRKEDNTLLLMA